jgi:hypothetical protein
VSEDQDKRFIKQLFEEGHNFILSKQTKQNLKAENSIDLAIADDLKEVGAKVDYF